MYDDKRISYKVMDLEVRKAKRCMMKRSLRKDYVAICIYYQGEFSVIMYSDTPHYVWCCTCNSV